MCISIILFQCRHTVWYRGGSAKKGNMDISNLDINIWGHRRTVYDGKKKTTAFLAAMIQTFLPPTEQTAFFPSNIDDVREPSQIAFFNDIKWSEQVMRLLASAMPTRNRWSATKTWGRHLRRQDDRFHVPAVSRANAKEVN